MIPSVEEIMMAAAAAKDAFDTAQGEQSLRELLRQRISPPSVSAVLADFAARYRKACSPEVGCDVRRAFEHASRETVEWYEEVSGEKLSDVEGFEAAIKFLCAAGMFANLGCDPLPDDVCRVLDLDVFWEEVGAPPRFARSYAVHHRP